MKPEDSTGSPETLFQPAQSSPLTQGNRCSSACLLASQCL